MKTGNRTLPETALQKFLKTRMETVDDLIPTDPYVAFKELEEGTTASRLPHLEAVVASKPFWSYRYAKEILKRRFLRGEGAIRKDPNYTYLYAKDVIGGRWKEGEETLANSQEYCFFYIACVIHGVEGGVRHQPKSVRERVWRDYERFVKSPRVAKIRLHDIGVDPNWAIQKLNTYLKKLPGEWTAFTTELGKYVWVQKKGPFDLTELMSTVANIFEAAVQFAGWKHKDPLAGTEFEEVDDPEPRRSFVNYQRQTYWDEWGGRARVHKPTEFIIEAEL